MTQANLPAGIAECDPALALRCYKILRAADDYANAVAKLARSEDRVRRMGDPLHTLEVRRQAARDRMAARLAEIMQPEVARGS